VKLLYFAWVRQKAGKSEEEVTPPEHVATVGDLIAWLKTQGPEYEFAFEDARTIRAAVDQTHAPFDASIRGAREVAFFPPVTGG
jgi:molybdopterin synthase sulfur carrier subunit